MFCRRIIWWVVLPKGLGKLAKIFGQMVDSPPPPFVAKNCPDAYVANALSSEKVNGDTINLYFDFFYGRDLCLNKTAFLWQVLTSTPLLVNRKRCRHTETILEKPTAGLRVSYYTCAPSKWGALAACHYQHHPTLYMHLWFCQLSREHEKPLFQTLKKIFTRERMANLGTAKNVRGYMMITGKRKKQSCPKERNEIDCGLYTWWFAKQYLSDCHSSVMYEGGVFGNEMAGDLLELETSFMQLVTNWHALVCHSRAINRNLHSSAVQHLRINPLTSDGIHQGEFISYQAWESYLHEMSRDGVWGDWITLWGLVNMLNIDTAVVSTLGEGGLRVINPADTSNTDHNLNRTTFLGHETEAHYHSLDYVFTPA